jgi:hypothetical protein
MRLLACAVGASFFALPLGRFPGSKQRQRRHFRLSREKPAAETGGATWGGYADSRLLLRIELGTAFDFSSSTRET